MAKPVHLPNGRQWRTRTAALAYFKEMLHRYQLGDRVPAGPDTDDLAALLQHYDRVLPPGAPTKVGRGIDYFSKGQVRREGFTSECFFVHRIDNDFDDFSYIDAVNS